MRASEGAATVSGDRCAGDVNWAGVAASRVIVGNDNLVRVTWLLAVNVSDCVTLGNVSVPVTRSTSVVPYASGANSLWISSPNAPRGERLNLPVPCRKQS